MRQWRLTRVGRFQRWFAPLPVKAESMRRSIGQGVALLDAEQRRIGHHSDTATGTRLQCVAAHAVPAVLVSLSALQRPKHV